MARILNWSRSFRAAVRSETGLADDHGYRGANVEARMDGAGNRPAFAAPLISLTSAIVRGVGERADHVRHSDAPDTSTKPQLSRKSYRSGSSPRQIALIGTSRELERLNNIAHLSGDRFRVVGLLDVEPGDAHIEPQLETLIAAAPVSEIVVAIGSARIPWDALARCRYLGIRVTDFLDFYEREARQVCIENLREDWIALSDGFKPAGVPSRLFDMVFAAVIFVLTSPLLLLTMLAIKIEDGGSFFYGQERTGLHGKSFVLYKLRSMRPDAERDGTPAWASQGDKRVTRVGRVIRKIRVDELPQLINVLRGEMAMIGPRPERPFFVRQFSETIPFYDYRHAVKPGITGWAQVSFRYGASEEDTVRKLSYDLYYVRNRSLGLDLSILLKTVRVVLCGEGAR